MSRHVNSAKLEGQVTAIDGKDICFARESKLENIVKISFKDGEMPNMHDFIRVSRKATGKPGAKFVFDELVPVDVYLKVKNDNISSYKHIGSASARYGDINGK